MEKNTSCDRDTQKDTEATISKRIIHLVKSSDMTQAEFSEYYHISLKTLQNWWYGIRKPPEYIVALLEQSEQKRKHGLYETVLDVLYKDIKTLKGNIKKTVALLPENLQNVINIDATFVEPASYECLNEKNIGQAFLRDLVEAAGISQAEFVKTYKIPSRTMTGWLSGERKVPEYVTRLLWNLEQDRKYIVSVQNEGKYLESVLNMTEFLCMIKNGNFTEEYKQSCIKGTTGRLISIAREHEQRKE